MDFLFFTAANAPLFVRNDAESASWVVDEYALNCAFPYDPAKVIQKGMRIAFADETGIIQPFEIRKVRTYEPDHYQELTCEHIVISELTDEHTPGAQLTDVTAQAALSGLLAGTLWQVGNNTATGTSSGDMALGSVWQNVRTIEANWNVYITPRVTFANGGITGRYLDIAPAVGTWRGVRLSLDKNADEVGVTIDDTNTLTALYGYGASTNGVPLDFSSAVWTATGDHPAKPAGQKYLEDPASTAAYGRNGRARFGFYQNGDITDAQTLLEKTWLALKATNAPTVTIDCIVRDLYRLGYADQPIRLHDTVDVEIRQTETRLQLEIVKLTVDLLDPTATRPTIGYYIPNIVYIQRQTARNATGSVANTSSGRRGGGGSGGKTAIENELHEFETEITANRYEISLRAYQRDMDNVDEILRQAGIYINADGVLVYADDNVNMLGSRFNVTAAAIEAEVTNRQNEDEQMSSRITQTADAITAEVTRATTAEGQMNSRITQTADAIALKANQTALDATNSRVASAEATLTVQAGQISSKVSETDFNGNTIASKINQTATTIKLEASKIDLDGYVTASQLQTKLENATNISTQILTVTGGTMYVGSGNATWQTQDVVENVTFTTASPKIVTLDASGNIAGTYTLNVLTGVNKTRKQMYYLGMDSGSLIG